MIRYLAAALVVATLASGPSPAQPPPANNGGAIRPPRGVMYPTSSSVFISSFALLLLPEVCQELKIDGDQLIRLDKELAVILRAYDAAIRELPGTGDDKERKQVAEIKDQAQRDGDTRLANVLRPEQIDRYRQIGFQRRRAEVFDDPNVHAQLKLTDDQSARLAVIAREQREKLRALRMMTNETIQKNDAERTERSLAVLTPEQRTAWNKLHGASFKIAPGTALRERKLPQP
jgi:hypothetical protein